MAMRSTAPARQNALPFRLLFVAALWSTGHAVRKRNSVSRTCSYKDLLNARATEEEAGAVAVLVDGFCGGRSARLVVWEGADQFAFAGLRWSEAPGASGPLTVKDEQYIKDYTGTFAYARNVEAQVLRGLVPFLNTEDPAGKWSSSSRQELTEEVLKWTVGLGEALNKLPDVEEPMKLWRGAWELASTVERLCTSPLPKGISLPWFQSTTTAWVHATEFIRQIYEPQKCSGHGGCFRSGQAFPVIYEFESSKGKDVRKWNPGEEELILLPNTPLDIRSCRKVLNDPFLDMDQKSLSEWLSREHTKLGDDSKKVGPFIEVANAVLAQKITGAKFVEMYESGSTGPPNWQPKWIVYLGLEDVNPNLQSEMYMATQARFRLPAKKGNYDLYVPNSVPYYYEIVAADALGLARA